MGPTRAEVIRVDAYTSYIKLISDARTGELRKEAVDYALSGPVRRRRRARWAQAVRRLVPRRMPAPHLPSPQPLPPQAFSSSPPSSR
jgi:hypothetical protein